MKNLEKLQDKRELQMKKDFIGDKKKLKQLEIN